MPAFLRYRGRLISHRRTGWNNAETINTARGQFSLAFPALRPRAHIIAFEPLPEAADVYERLFARDGLTRLQRVALSRSEGSGSVPRNRQDRAAMGYTFENQIDVVTSEIAAGLGDE